MIATTRLLTTGSAVSAVVSRNVHIAAILREFKIVGPNGASSHGRSILRKLRKITSIGNFSITTSSNDSMPCRAVPSVSKPTQMEPSSDVCDVQKNLSLAVCDLTSHSSDNSAPSDENLGINIVDEADVEATMGGQKFRKASMNKQKYRSMRPWRPFGSAATAVNSETHFLVKILSYNILAQNLLDNHRYLYTQHNKEALNWERRIVLLQQEILRTEANVICLQEMLIDHLEEFLVVFEKAGYDYLYKRRTNDKKDGLLLLYRANQLKLVEHAKVELYQPNIDILNRDNVAIVAKFSLIECPATHFIVSTTHLLYNPRREDVRLAQTQLLFAELDRLAFIKFTKNGPRYHPIILSGDFNLQPQTGVYKFITEGSFEFRGRGRDLQSVPYCGLGNSLIPPSLLVTDDCQYYDTLIKRFRGNGDDTTMLDDFKELKASSDEREKSNNDEMEDKVDTRTLEYQNVKIAEGRYAKFSSGSLAHPFGLRSLYCHENNDGEPEATTYQDKWVTVDYIFYSGFEPVSKYNLPSVSECENLPTIPNGVVGSDHLCLGGSFKLKKTKR